MGPWPGEPGRPTIRHPGRPTIRHLLRVALAPWRRGAQSSRSGGADPSRDPPRWADPSFVVAPLAADQGLTNRSRIDLLAWQGDTPQYMRFGCVGRRAPAVALLVAASGALADTPSADRVKAAAEEFDAGRRAYLAKDYDTAATHFENADRDAPAPEAIRNAIRARNDAKQFARAATLAAAALARYPDDKNTAKFAKQVLSASEKKLHRVKIQCEPACTLLVDGKLSPLPEGSDLVVYVDPGDHQLSAGWSKERHRDEKFTGDAGKETSLKFKAPPLPKPPPPPAPTATESAPASAEAPPPPPPKPLSKPIFYTAAGVTALLGGITLWSALDMRANPGRDKVRRDCAGKTESCPTYQDALQKQTRTNVLLAVSAGAVVATGVVAYFTEWSSGAAPTTGAHVRPTVALGNGWFLGAEGAF